MQGYWKRFIYYVFSVVEAQSFPGVLCSRDFLTQIDSQ